MPEHCGHQFTVYELELNSGGALYPSREVEAGYCPFCGRKMKSVSLPPKSAPQSKREPEEYAH